MNCIRQKGTEIMRKSNTPGGEIDRLEYQEEQLRLEFERLKRISTTFLLLSLKAFPVILTQSRRL